MCGASAGVLVGNFFGVCVCSCSQSGRVTSLTGCRRGVENRLKKESVLCGVVSVILLPGVDLTEGGDSGGGTPTPVAKEAWSHYPSWMH